MQKNSTRQTIRILGIGVLVLLFGGMIAHSACSVRYSLDGVPTSELVVTDLSLVHMVERDSDGNLTNPYAEESSAPVKSDNIAVKAAEDKGENKVSIASQPENVQELAAKKPKPKPKKPPAKKNPPKKKPAKPKKPACPT